MSLSKHLAIGLNENPGQQSHIVVRRDIAYFKMASREFLVKRGHIFNDLRSTGAQIMSNSLIFNVLAQSFGGDFQALLNRSRIPCAQIFFVQLPGFVIGHD